MKDIASYKDAHLRIFDRPKPTSPHDLKTIHLIGICGTGMGSLAGLLKSAGYDVRGSDAAAYPPMSTRLAAMNIDVFEGYSVENLDPIPDLTVVGNACTPSHPEAAFARENDLTQMSLPEAVGYFFFDEKKPIVVAGTHGKTTTTGLVIHILSHLGLDPGYLVGGVLKDRDSSYAVGTGDYFIIEGDEYDSAYFDKRPKFMHYQPHIAIVTSLEFDHVDIYEDFEDYVAAFQRFVEIVDPKGHVILNVDDPNVAALRHHTSANVVTYGLSEGADFQATDLSTKDSTQTFTLKINGQSRSSVELPMNGRHNVLNSLASIASAVMAGAAPDDVVKSLRSFEGLKRRQEIVVETKDIVVLDDFAHHPTAVSETIQAIRQKYPDSRIIAVFEPRSNSSRRKVFEAPYIEAFAHADVALISSPPFRHNDNMADFMDIDAVVSGIAGSGVDAYSFEEFEDLFSTLCSTMASGDVVLIMSNGGFSGIHERLRDVVLNSPI